MPPEPSPADLALASQLVVDQLRALAGDWAVPVPRLRWDARRKAALLAAGAASRQVLPLVPGVLRRPLKIA